MGRYVVKSLHAGEYFTMQYLAYMQLTDAWWQTQSLGVPVRNGHPS